jgi:colanic acid/amylovoran biosynthesis glycosyltransferase
MSRGNVAFLITSFPNYSETFIIDQINYLIDQGFQVTIFAKTLNKEVQLTENITRNKLLDKLVLYSQPVQMPPAIGKRIMAAMRILFSGHSQRSLLCNTCNPFRFGRKAFSLHYIFLLNNLKKYIGRPFDVAHAHFGQNGKLLFDMQQLRLLKAKRTIVSFHGSDLHFHDAAYYKKLFRSGYRFTVNSKYMAQKLVHMGAQKAEVIPMAVNDMFLKVGMHSENKNTFTIITIARLIPVKGIINGLKAVQKLKEEGIIEIQYHIIGDGPLHESLTKWTVDHGIAGMVHFLGSQTHEEIVEYLKKADVFILPGITTKEGAQEAQGLVVQEAQAMYLPVIVTDAGGMREGMIHEKTGFVVKQHDVEELAGRIKQLFLDKELLKQMGAAGHDFVKQNYSSQKLMSKLVEELYL